MEYLSGRMKISKISSKKRISQTILCGWMKIVGISLVGLIVGLCDGCCLMPRREKCCHEHGIQEMEKWKPTLSRKSKITTSHLMQSLQYGPRNGTAIEQGCSKSPKIPCKKGCFRSVIFCRTNSEIHFTNHDTTITQSQNLHKSSGHTQTRRTHQDTTAKAKSALWGKNANRN